MLWVAVTGNDRFEMYDLDTDPTELVNVANDPGRLTERTALKTQLDSLAPVDRNPHFVWGTADTTDGSVRVSDPVTIPAERLVIIDVYGSITGSFSEDFVVSSSPALTDVAQIGSPLDLVIDGVVTRRLVSWRARGSGEQGQISVSSGGSFPTLSSFGFVVTYYDLYNGIIQTATNSGSTAATSFSATLGALQQSDHRAHYSVLRNPSSAGTDNTTGEGTEIFDQGHGSPNCRFAVYNGPTLDVTPTATGGSSTRWGVIAHEIGT